MSSRYVYLKKAFNVVSSGTLLAMQVTCGLIIKLGEWKTGWTTKVQGWLVVSY